MRTRDAVLLCLHLPEQFSRPASSSSSPRARPGTSPASAMPTPSSPTTRCAAASPPPAATSCPRSTASPTTPPRPPTATGNRGAWPCSTTCAATATSSPPSSATSPPGLTVPRIEATYLAWIDFRPLGVADPASLLEEKPASSSPMAAYFGGARPRPPQLRLPAARRWAEKIAALAEPIRDVAARRRCHQVRLERHAPPPTPSSPAVPAIPPPASSPSPRSGVLAAPGPRACHPLRRPRPAEMGKPARQARAPRQLVGQLRPRLHPADGRNPPRLRPERQARLDRLPPRLLDPRPRGRQTLHDLDQRTRPPNAMPPWSGSTAARTSSAP